ncbi:MAG: serine protease [Firmicutes bacterium]|nr:serine protease [Bacillota bacterium]
MKEKDTGKSREFDMPITENGRKLYTAHENKNIDIAVITINGRFINANNLSFSAFDIDAHALSSSEFVENGGDEGSYVYMLGFPMGLVNINSNSPICRTGCIARIDSNEIETTQKILLDIQNFPGNSGSPIIAKPELVGIEGTKSLHKAALVGIVSGYIPYKERRYDPDEKKIVEVNSENSGIAVANPVEFIREVMQAEDETKCLQRRY